MIEEHPTYLSWFAQREEISILRLRELRLRERIDHLSDRVEELREQRDLALHDLWKAKLHEGYWRRYGQRMRQQKEACKKRTERACRELREQREKWRKRALTAERNHEQSLFLYRLKRKDGPRPTRPAPPGLAVDPEEAEEA